jgi:hypothetical protein
MMSGTHTNDTLLIRSGTTRVAVFMISLSLIMNELLLTRIFSLIFMYHFAFMVISLALFGLGVGGIAVYLFPARFSGDLQSRLVRMALAFAAALLFSVLFLFNLPLIPSSSCSR